jgi:hypothetical protein
MYCIIEITPQEIETFFIPLLLPLRLAESNTIGSTGRYDGGRAFAQTSASAVGALDRPSQHKST